MSREQCRRGEQRTRTVNWVRGEDSMREAAQEAQREGLDEKTLRGAQKQLPQTLPRQWQHLKGLEMSQPSCTLRQTQ